jgi:hypothetical protein
VQISQTNCTYTETADIFATQELMGHSSISTTKRYLYHAEAMKVDLVNNCLPSLELWTLWVQENPPN